MDSLIHCFHGMWGLGQPTRGLCLSSSHDLKMTTHIFDSMSSELHFLILDEKVMDYATAKFPLQLHYLSDAGSLHFTTNLALPP